MDHEPAQPTGICLDQEWRQLYVSYSKANAVYRYQLAKKDCHRHGYQRDEDEQRQKEDLDLNTEDLFVEICHWKNHHQSIIIRTEIQQNKIKISNYRFKEGFDIG